MPTIVIHQMGRAARTSSFAGTSLRVGRDPAANDLALPGSTVSREHLVIQKGTDGRWSVRCVSETNPIVVDGAMTASSAFLAEGSEILVGTEYLLIFSETAVTAQGYLGQGYFSNAECSGCHWTGMVSTLRRAPVCPRCGGRDLAFEVQYRPETSSQKAMDDSTTAVDARQVRAQLSRLREAKRSHLVRIDPHEPGSPRKALSETEALTIGKTADCRFRLFGFSIGSGIRITWEQSHYVARGSMFWPSMKVNGAAAKVATLTNGDVIEVGGNRFRFVTE